MKYFVARFWRISNFFRVDSQEDTGYTVPAICWTVVSMFQTHDVCVYVFVI